MWTGGESVGTPAAEQSTTQSYLTEPRFLATTLQKLEKLVKQADVDKVQLREQFVTLQNKFRSFASKDALGKDALGNKENVA